MANTISAFQIMEGSQWSGNTLPSTLGAVWEKEPVKAYNFVTRVLAANNIPDRARMLEKYPVLKVDTPDTEVTWDLIGSPMRNIQLIEARVAGSTVTTASTAVGIAGATFKLVFGEHMFFVGDIVVGELNEIYPIRILSEPQYEGTQVAYDVQLYGPAQNVGMPGTQLVAGKRFSSEDYAPTTLIKSGPKGGIGGSSPFAMKQEMGFYRKDYTVSGIELQRKLNIVMPAFDNTGKLAASNFSMTVPYKDWLFEMKFANGIGNAIYFGRSNRDAQGNYLDKDFNGELIKQGSGIREQMQVMNTKVYDEFNLKDVETAIYEMVAGKLDMAKAKFKMVTGLKGAEQFSKKALDVATGWMASGQHQNFGGNGNINTIKSISSEIHSNAFQMGFQIVSWLGPNGFQLDIEIDPTYDDPVRNKIYKDNNPAKGVAESYRYDIFFDGMIDSEKANIQIVKVKGLEGGLRGYVNGPFGDLWKDARIGNNSAATQIDEYSCSKIMSIGVVVRDPSRTFTLLPQELAHMQ